MNKPRLQTACNLNAKQTEMLNRCIAIIGEVKNDPALKFAFSVLSPAKKVETVLEYLINDVSNIEIKE